MFRNYFKIAWRSLRTHRIYSIINISGLGIGMAVVLLISLWIQDELNYNKSFSNYDRIVKVMQNQTHGNDIRTNGTMPIPLAGALRTQYASDFKRVALTSWNSGHVLAVGDKQLNMHGTYVQPDMLDMLSLRNLDGSKASLDDPTSILISRSLALALFGTTDAVNKTLKIDNQHNLKVAGVFPDMPYSSDFNEVTFWLPWAEYEAAQPWVKSSATVWNNNAFMLFAELQEGVDLDKVGEKVRHTLEGHDRKDKPEILLHPMRHWHLYDNFWNGKNIGGTISLVRLFGIIGGFVLLLACINFMNLSTARSEKRAKEVGIRKAVGSFRRQLVGQFLGESVFMAMLAGLLAILLTLLSLPWFNHVADKHMQLPWGQPLFWGISLGFILLVGLIAGSYPAFYLSSFNPVKVLKGTFKAGRWSALPRQVLIVLQFAVSVILIVGTIVVFQQIVYVKGRSVGYSRDGLLTVDVNTKDLQTHYEAIRQELMQSGAAANVALSNSPTTAVWANQNSFEWEGKDPAFLPSLAVFHVSHDFGATIDWQLEDGRDFSRSFASDSSAVILNETCVRYMGLKHPVGATIKFLHSDHTEQSYHVVGVVKDIVMESPFSPVKQTIFFMDYDKPNVITVRMNPHQPMDKSLSMMEAIFRKYNAGAPFQYKFNDDEYARKFELEERTGTLATFFTVLAIFISCLGLFGLASFMAEQRTKEIGVRKVLGASVWSLWRLLSKDFLVLVGVSFLLAVPLAWYVMHGWLQQYNYRVPLTAGVFVVTIAMALLITLATVSYQSVRAALVNPVRSLRTE